MRTIRSKRGAVRRCNAILRQCRRALRGGLQFGMDWPTLRANFPAAYAELMDLNARFSQLPE